MLLYLVQHAEAASEAEDAARDLTQKGRMDIESVAHHLKRLNLQVSQIFHSGKTRAKSTARVLARHLQPQAGISEARGLACGCKCLARTRAVLLALVLPL